MQPHETYEKVAFDAWRQTTYDQNDTSAPRPVPPGGPPPRETGDPRTDPDIGGYVAEYFKALPPGWQTWYAQRSGGALGPRETAAAERARAHADTPTIAHFDVLGRPFLTETQNRVVCAGHDLDGTETTFMARVDLDIEGHRRALRDTDQQGGDSLGRVVARLAYDVLGNLIRQQSMERVHKVARRGPCRSGSRLRSRPASDWRVLRWEMFTFTWATEKMLHDLTTRRINSSQGSKLHSRRERRA